MKIVIMEKMRLKEEVNDGVMRQGEMSFRGVFQTHTGSIKTENNG